MDKEELKELFEKNVRYIQKTVPPDDIYIFAEQTLMASMYFLRTIAEYKGIADLAGEDPIFDKWVRNVGYFFMAQQEDLDMTLDLKMDELDE